MKSKEQIKAEIKKLDAKIEKIWHDKEMMKLDRIEVVSQKIKTLKSVLRK